MYEARNTTLIKVHIYVKIQNYRLVESQSIRLDTPFAPTLSFVVIFFFIYSPAGGDYLHPCCYRSSAHIPCVSVC